MKKSKRLQQISRIGEHREDEAGRQLAESRQAADQQQQQLDQLQQYRAEYAKQFQSFAAEGVDPRQLNNYRTFLRNLNTAIEQQQLTVEQKQAIFDDSHRQWLVTRQRLEALNKAVEKQQGHEQYADNKREQSESDEQAARSERGEL